MKLEKQCNELETQEHTFTEDEKSKASIRNAKLALWDVREELDRKHRPELYENETATEDMEITGLPCFDDRCKCDGCEELYRCYIGLFTMLRREISGTKSYGTLSQACSVVFDQVQAMHREHKPEAYNKTAKSDQTDGSIAFVSILTLNMKHNR